MEPYLLTLKAKKGSKTWVAEILGRSRKYGYEREFVASIDFRPGRKKTAGEKDYALDQGIYEICELDERRYGIVGHRSSTDMKPEMMLITKDHVLKTLAEIKRLADESARLATGEIDSHIARFNAEGGFSQN